MKQCWDKLGHLPTGLGRGRAGHLPTWLEGGVPNPPVNRITCMSKYLTFPCTSYVDGNKRIPKQFIASKTNTRGYILIIMIATCYWRVKYLLIKHARTTRLLKVFKNYTRIKEKNIHDYHETRTFCRERIYMFFSIFSYHNIKQSFHIAITFSIKNFALKREDTMSFGFNNHLS